jgi:hypothetical protein
LATANDAARDVGGQETTNTELREYAVPLREPEPFRPVDENPAKAILEELEACDEWATAPDAYEPQARARKKQAIARRRKALEPLKSDEYMVGVGGEPVAPEAPQEEWIQDELRHPNRVNMQAALHRATLAQKAGALAIGLDFADAMKAETSLERALCQQLGAAHSVAMKLAERTRVHLQNTEWESLGIERRLTHGAAAAKSALAFARVTEAFQRGYTVLLERRNGTPRSVVVRQEVTVVHQHAHVSPTAVVKGGGATR